MSKLPLCPWPMPALVRSMLVLPVALIGCESASAPEVDTLPSFSGAHKSPAKGIGQFEALDGDLWSFGFSTLELGSSPVGMVVPGAFAAHNQTTGLRVQGVVTCFTISGNQAWIGGIVAQPIPGPVPNVNVRPVGFRVIDNGTAGSPSADRISLIEEATTAQAYCANQEDQETHAVVAGGIQVSE